MPLSSIFQTKRSSYKVSGAKSLNVSPSLTTERPQGPQPGGREQPGNGSICISAECVPFLLETGLKSWNTKKLQFVLLSICTSWLHVLSELTSLPTSHLEQTGHSGWRGVEEDECAAISCAKVGVRLSRVSLLEQQPAYPPKPGSAFHQPSLWLLLHLLLLQWHMVSCTRDRQSICCERNIKKEQHFESLRC